MHAVKTCKYIQLSILIGIAYQIYFFIVYNIAMPRQTSQDTFPRDEEGQYLTLDVLRRFKNADTVSIQSVQVGNHKTSMVPHLHSVDDSPTSDSSPKKVYFKAVADVSVTYKRQDGHLTTSRLQDIKDRGFSTQG